MMTAPEPKERLANRIPITLKREAEKRAEEAGQTLSVWLERAIKGYLEISKKD